MQGIDCFLFSHPLHFPLSLPDSPLPHLTLPPYTLLAPNSLKPSPQSRLWGKKRPYFILVNVFFWEFTKCLFIVRLCLLIIKLIISYCHLIDVEIKTVKEKKNSDFFFSSHVEKTQFFPTTFLSCESPSLLTQNSTGISCHHMCGSFLPHQQLILCDTRCICCNLSQF